MYAIYSLLQLLVLQPEYHWAVMAEHWPRYLPSCFVLLTRDAHLWWPSVMLTHDAHPWCRSICRSQLRLWLSRPINVSHSQECSKWARLGQAFLHTENYDTNPSITSALLTFWAWPPHVPVCARARSETIHFLGQAKWTGQIEELDSTKGHVHYCASENLAVAGLETNWEFALQSRLAGDLCMYECERV